MLVLVDGLLHPAGGPPEKDAQHTHAVLIDFIAEAVCNRTQRMLRGGVLSDARSGVQTSAGIDEDNLSVPSDQIGQQRLRELIRRAHVDLVLLVERSQPTFDDTAKGDGPGGMHNEMDFRMTVADLNRKLP